MCSNHELPANSLHLNWRLFYVCVGSSSESPIFNFVQLGAGSAILGKLMDVSISLIIERLFFILLNLLYNQDQRTLAPPGSPMLLRPPVCHIAPGLSRIPHRIWRNFSMEGFYDHYVALKFPLNPKYLSIPALV